MPRNDTARKDPLWIPLTSAAVMLIGARLVRAFTPYGYNVITEPFDPLLLLVDIAIHLALWYAAYLPLRALWERRAAGGAAA